MIKTKKQIISMFYNNYNQQIINKLYKKHYKRMCNSELIDHFNKHYPSLAIEFISNNRFLLRQKTANEFDNQRFLKSEKHVIDAFMNLSSDRSMKKYLKQIKNKAIF